MIECKSSFKERLNQLKAEAKKLIILHKNSLKAGLAFEAAEVEHKMFCLAYRLGLKDYPTFFLSKVQSTF